jgi:hypothetical protein
MTFIFKAKENKLDYPSILLLMFVILPGEWILKKIYGSEGFYLLHV